MPTERTEPVRTITLTFHEWEHRSTPPYTFIAIDGVRVIYFATDLELDEAANLFALAGQMPVRNRAASVSDSLDASILGASFYEPWPNPVWTGTAEGWAAVERSGQWDPFMHAVLEAAARIGGEEILKGLS